LHQSIYRLWLVQIWSFARCCVAAARLIWSFNHVPALMVAPEQALGVNFPSLALLAVKPSLSA